MSNLLRRLPAALCVASIALLAQTSAKEALIKYPQKAETTGYTGFHGGNQRLNQSVPKHAAPPPSPDANGYVGNQACAGCHSAIYDSYLKTSMANASGPASNHLMPAEFVHRQSGVHYRIYADTGKVWLSFERPNDPEVRGKRELLYYIGSGRRGRSYLFATDDFMFESPVNWYTDRHVWDMAPAYENARQIPMNLPAFTSCLHCHVSGLNPPIAGTENRYSMPPFSYSGVACERCHGPGAAHIKGGAIVNPAKLDPARRDDVCMQCHLEGKAAIENRGRHIYEFRPGQPLADYIHYFVFAEQSRSLGAVSQVEALAQSVCRKKSGAAMSCISCHDPHSEPAAAQRVSYYRKKCLDCHGAAFGAKHHTEQGDCAACHMPSALSTDVVHTEVTDHRILRRPPASSKDSREANTLASLPRLVRFPDAQKTDDDVRDLALAWESLVNSGMTAAAPEADRSLRSAVEKYPNDPVLLSGLGYSAQSKGDDDHARQLYEKALGIDPLLIDAATNLGVIDANRGQLREALKLWEDAFQRAPGQSRIGMNIARVLCESGQPAKARDYVMRVLEFNPDLPEAKSLLHHLNGDTPKCKD